MSTGRVIGAALLLLLLGCAKSKPSVAPGDIPFTIVATDSGFVLPDTLHAGLNHFVYENRGREIHECMFIRLPDGMSTADYVAQVKSGIDFPAGALDCSGPGLTSPGGRVEMWVPLEEGNYMLGCWPNDHLTTIPPVSFVVHGAPATPVQPPREDVLVRLKDFQFELVGSLKSGEQVLRYDTLGPSMHEADIIRLEVGRTVDDARKWFKAKESGPAPGVLGGGCLDSHDLKRATWVKLAFPPGRYLFWCDMPMVQNAPEADPAAHVMHSDAGMFKEVTID